MRLKGLPNENIIILLMQWIAKYLNIGKKYNLIHTQHIDYICRFKYNTFRKYRLISGNSVYANEDELVVLAQGTHIVV